MKLPKPRLYQEKGLNLLRKAFVDGYKKPLLFMATGSGKSVMFLNIVGNLLKNGKKVCIVVRRKQLVFQTKEHFTKAQIDSSMMLNTQKGFSPEKSLQICSIDTVLNRDYSFMREFDFVLVDECHDATSDGYTTFLNSFSEKTRFIGLTATPFPVGKKIHSFWDCVVKPIEVSELRDLGFLVDASVFVPTDIDLSDLKNDASGDYAKKELSKKMQEMTIVGDIVENYKKYGMNKPAVAFCVDKDHSQLICESFNHQGISAIHCDESTPQKERDDAIKKIKSGEIKVLCNVNIFSTGVDIPELEVGLMARPTKSECLYIQQVGRILRPYRKCGKCKSQYDNSKNCYVCGYDKPEYIKEKAIIIDFGNNSSRHGQPFDVRFAVIKEEDKKEREKKEKPLTKTCKNCFMVYDAKLAACPNCEGVETKERIYKTADGKFVLYDEYEDVKRTFTQLQKIALETGKKPNWKYFKIYERYKDTAMKYKKEFNIPSWIPAIYKKNMEEKLSGTIYN